MPITSTSTEWAILVSQVSWLQQSFDGVVGGITLAVSIVIVLSGLAQYFYVRRTQEADIEKLKSQLTTEFRAEIDKRALDLQAYSDKSVDDKVRSGQDELRLQLDQFKRKAKELEADIARSFAISTRKNGHVVNSLDWWLAAAAGYSFSPSSTILPIALKNSLELVNELKPVHSADLLEGIDNLRESLADIKNNTGEKGRMLVERFDTKLTELAKGEDKNVPQLKA